VVNAATAIAFPGFAISAVTEYFLRQSVQRGRFARLSFAYFLMPSRRALRRPRAVRLRSDLCRFDPQGLSGMERNELAQRASVWMENARFH